MAKRRKTTRNHTIRHKRRRKQVSQALLLLVWLLAVCVIWRTVCLVSDRSGTAQTGESTGKETRERIRQADVVPEENEQLVTGQGVRPQAGEVTLTSEEIEEVKRIYAQEPELLVLVNKEYPLSEDYDRRLCKICGGRLQASDRLYTQLNEMLRDGREAGYSYWIASAYRSRQRQQALINEDVRTFMSQGMSREDAMAKTLEETMPAGHSEHETGLALDILCSDNLKMDSTQEQSAGNVWLRQHCAEYGFILRYPRTAALETGISYEPWHFRYVGVQAAEFITRHGLTLEGFCEAALSQ